MAEKSIDPKALEDALRNVLKTLLPTSSGTSSNPREEFYHRFQTESKEYDEYFLKKYGNDLDITLLFAALFSAISASFIVAVQTQLQPDFSQLSYAALLFIANSTQTRGSNQLPNFGVSLDKAIWTGPNSTVVHVQAVLFSSLAISLLAALIAMLSKQWLSRYSKSHGSVTDRGRDRQRKFKGVTSWHFNLIIECLPLLLQAALLLFGYAISIYLFTINNTVAAVAIAFTSFGLLFYFLIVFAATLSYNCPFQTPLSLFLRFLFRLKDKDKNYLEQAWSLLKPMFRLCCSGGHHAPEEDRGDHVELVMGGPFPQPPRLAGWTTWGNYVLDTECIAWLSQRSRSTEVVMAIAGLIPEIIWYDSMGASPLKQLYDIMLECFDSSSEPPALIPKLKEKAYLSAKALVHLAVQRKGIESEEEVFKSISSKHSTIRSWNCGGDQDLESTLGMVDRVFGDDNPPPICWERFSFTVPHQTWMGYTIRCYASHALKNNNPLPRDVEQFILSSLTPEPPSLTPEPPSLTPEPPSLTPEPPSLTPEPPSPAPVMAECLHIIGLVLGITFQNFDQQAVDERISSQIDRIYEELERVWRTNSTEEFDRALKAMKLIAPLARTDVATKSYRLYHTISTTSPSEKQLKASRLALHSACEGAKPQLLVDDSQGQDLDGPTHNALRALADASNPTTIGTPGHLDLESFVHGIRFAFKVDRPHKLRERALLLLPLSGDKWFDAAHKIIPGEMKSFCADWAAVVDSIEHTSDAQKAILTALLRMMDSPHWRPHIPEGKWKLLEYYPSLPDDCPPLKRCLENQELVAAILQMTDPEAIALWPRILWLNYDKLAAPVQEALREATNAPLRSHIDTCYLKAVESGLKEAEEKRLKYPTSSNDPAAAALDKKIRSHREASDALKAIKRRR